jgi:hypothetical protein
MELVQTAWVLREWASMGLEQTAWVRMASTQTG